MAIPNLRVQYEVRGKVRIGEKRESRSGSSFPSSLDYFTSEDPEFAGMKQPKWLLIEFPYPEVDDCFSTGLEWWMRSRQGKTSLACYTHDGGDKPIALRMEAYLQGDEDVLGPERGSNRLPIACGFRKCPEFKKGLCKPMGRLQFFLQGGRTDQVLQLDTKSWNSIEKITPVLQAARQKGPLNAPGRIFSLSVEMVARGDKKFPVLTVQEVPVQDTQGVEVTDPALKHAAGMCELESAKQASKTAREQLAAYLDVTDPNWRQNEKLVGRIQEIGVEAAIANLEARGKNDNPG